MKKFLMSFLKTFVLENKSYLKTYKYRYYIINEKGIVIINYNNYDHLFTCIHVHNLQQKLKNKNLIKNIVIVKFLFCSLVLFPNGQY